MLQYLKPMVLKKDKLLCGDKIIFENLQLNF